MDAGKRGIVTLQVKTVRQVKKESWGGDTEASVLIAEYHDVSGINQEIYERVLAPALGLREGPGVLAQLEGALVRIDVVVPALGDELRIERSPEESVDSVMKVSFWLEDQYLLHKKSEEPQ